MGQRSEACHRTSRLLSSQQDRDRRRCLVLGLLLLLEGTARGVDTSAHNSSRNRSVNATIQVRLEGLRTLYINKQGDRVRQDHMEQVICPSLKLRCERVEGPDGVRLGIGKSPGTTTAFVRTLYKGLLAEPFQPFLILEDDVAINPYHAAVSGGREVIEVPADADAVFFGLAGVGLMEDKVGFYQPPWRHRLPGFPDLFTVWNMLCAHAVWIGTRRFGMAYMLAFMEAAVKGTAGDHITPRLYLRFNVMALAEPVFYQDSHWGGREELTRISWSDANDTIPEPIYSLWLEDRDMAGYHRVRTLSVLGALEIHNVTSPWFLEEDPRDPTTEPQVQVHVQVDTVTTSMTMTKREEQEL